MITKAAIIFGICVAVLSFLQPKVEWISSFCGFLGDGCKDTEQYTLLGLSISLWGLGYFLMLLTVSYLRPSWLFMGVMAGIGVEVALIRIMILSDTICVMCVANAAVMLILLLMQFDRKRIYEMASIALLLFVVFGALISNGVNATQQDDPDTVVARVGAEEITLGELNQALTSRLYDLEKAKYRLKMQYLEQMTADLVLELEANEKGLSAEELKISVVDAEVAPVPDTVVDHIYDSEQYKSMGFGNLEGSEQEIKEQIKARLTQRNLKNRILRYYDELKKKHTVTLYLQEPPLPPAEIKVDGYPAKGPKNAPVTIVEFSDYHCARCRKGHDMVRKLQELYEGRIRWVFRDYPLNSHPEAKELAIAAKAAGMQGKFWEYHELLFSNEKKPKGEDIPIYAKQLGLDMGMFNEHLSGATLQKELVEDIREAKRAGISQTPTFIINGKLLLGMPSLEDFTTLIGEALKDAE